jgi:hypothetical protein
MTVIRGRQAILAFVCRTMGHRFSGWSLTCERCGLDVTQ